MDELNYLIERIGHDEEAAMRRRADEYNGIIEGFNTIIRGLGGG